MKPVLIMVAVALAGVAFGAQAHAVPTVSPAAQPLVPTPSYFSTCGTLVEVTGTGGGDPRYVLTVVTPTQARIRVRLVGQGSAPADLNDQFRRGVRQVVTISGVEGAVQNSTTPDANTVLNFAVTRVASCTMPNTSTNAESGTTE